MRSENMQNYWNLLQEAIETTDSLGLGKETFAQVSSKIIKPEHGPALVDAVSEEIGFGALSLADIAFQCARINWQMKPKFEEIIQDKILLTLGTVIFQGQSLWDIGNLDLNELRTLGTYHVWWSLASGEIVDVTLMPSLVFQHGADPRHAVPLAGFPQQFPQIEWIPKLVGDQLVRQLLNLGL